MRGSAFSAVAHVIIQIEEVGEGADVIAIAGVGLDRFGNPFVTARSAGAMLFEPRGPAEDLKRRAFRIRAHPGQNLRVGLRGFYLGQHSLVIDARELEKLAIQRAMEVITRVLSRQCCPCLVEQSSKMCVTADAHAKAAWRVLGENGRGVVDHCDWEK